MSLTLSASQRKSRRKNGAVDVGTGLCQLVHEVPLNDSGHSDREVPVEQHTDEEVEVSLFQIPDHARLSGGVLRCLPSVP